jgi:hypothetical protein
MDKSTFYKLIMIKWTWNANEYIRRYELMDVYDASTILGVRLRTVRNWERRMLMPPRQKRGRRFYYRAIDIEHMREVMASEDRPIWMAYVKRGR